jgi:hypothetical protein
MEDSFVSGRVDIHSRIHCPCTHCRSRQSENGDPPLSERHQRPRS